MYLVVTNNRTGEKGIQMRYLVVWYVECVWLGPRVAEDVLHASHRPQVKSYRAQDVLHASHQVTNP